VTVELIRISVHSFLYQSGSDQICKTGIWYIPKALTVKSFKKDLVTGDSLFGSLCCEFLMCAYALTDTQAE